MSKMGWMIWSTVLLVWSVILVYFMSHGGSSQESTVPVTDIWFHQSL